jgi:hypothetical protein
MSTSPEPPAGSKGSAEIGPAPYFHRSDCSICAKQDGLKTGSELLDTPIPGGYVVESEHFLIEHAPLQESNAVRRRPSRSPTLPPVIMKDAITKV